MPSRYHYGTAHRRLRAAVKLVVDRGEAYCARCGGWINPLEGFDLDHRDEDRTKYLGPSHVRCNRATAGRRKQREAHRWVL